MAPKPPSCRSCGAEVEWYTTKNGKPIMLDVGTFENGNLTVDGATARRRTDDDDVQLRPRRRAHFASCPHAEQWRKRGG